MPSKDEYQGRKDDNLNLSAPEKPSVTVRKGVVREMPAMLLRLARRMGTDPDVLASKYTPDTLRRLKYAAIEEVEEDGSRRFKDDPMIEEGRRAEIRR